MGHALNGSIQDTLIRWHRMRGMRTKWILGTDHAGIATQTQVEKRCWREGTSREEIGREAFIRAGLGVARAVRRHDHRAVQAPRRLAATTTTSASRSTRPTPARSRRSSSTSIEKGLIYRDNYMVNWDPGSRSAISDLEVEEREVTDTLFQIAYPLERRLGRGRRRDRAPGDDARRHRGRRAPRRRALPAPHRRRP